MESVQFYLDNQPIDPPKNWQEIGIEVNFDKDADHAVSLVNEWEFVRENIDQINAYLEGGLTGGVGITEGLRFAFEVFDGTNLEKPFSGYLDLSDAEFGKDIIKAKAKEYKQIDWLNDVATGFTFQYLYDKGYLRKNDNIAVPYVINSIPNYTQAALMLLTVYTVEQQLEQVIDKLAELIAEMSNPFEATAIVRAVIYVAYITLLIVALIKLIQDLIYNIIQPVKYHTCMTIERQLTAACSYLGMTLNWPFIQGGKYKNACIMPVKYQNPPNTEGKSVLGFDVPDLNAQMGYYNGTFADLLIKLKSIFHVRYVIDGNELKVLPEGETIGAPQYTLPDIENRVFKVNLSELPSNTEIAFNIDTVDKNTMQEYTGTVFQVIHTQNTFTDPYMTTLKGFRLIDIPFALAKTKTELTEPESIINTFIEISASILGGIVDGVNLLIDVYNEVVDFINDIVDALDLIGIDLGFELPELDPIAPPNFGNVINNRIGMLQLENDFTSVPKIFVLDQNLSIAATDTNSDSSNVVVNPEYNKIDALNGTLFNAETIYDSFYSETDIMPTSNNVNGGQYIIKNYQKVPFTLADFKKVKNNNWINTASGQRAKIVSLKWHIWKQYAEMVIYINQKYTNNIHQTRLIPNGR